MTEREIIERVRKDIGRIIWAKYGGGNFELADKILSHKNIAVINPDAELPDYGYLHDAFNGDEQLMHDIQIDMLKAGWVKKVSK